MVVGKREGGMNWKIRGSNVTVEDLSTWVCGLKGNHEVTSI